MALDTAVKRWSAIFMGSPWRGILPFPDGTTSLTDEQVHLFLCSDPASEQDLSLLITSRAILNDPLDYYLAGTTPIHQIGREFEGGPTVITKKAVALGRHSSVKSLGGPASTFTVKTSGKGYD